MISLYDQLNVLLASLQSHCYFYTKARFSHWCLTVHVSCSWQLHFPQPLNAASMWRSSVLAPPCGHSAQVQIKLYFLTFVLFINICILLFMYFIIFIHIYFFLLILFNILSIYLFYSYFILSIISKNKFLKCVL